MKTIEPDECSSSVRSTPVPQTSTKPNPKPSLLSSILSPNSTEASRPTATGNSYADVKMAAQHREIERLVESRQRLHTLKDQIANLHQSMNTPPVPSKKTLEPMSSLQVEVPKIKKQSNAYADNQRNIRATYPIENQDDDDSELYRFECESGDGEEIDDETGKKNYYGNKLIEYSLFSFRWRYSTSNQTRSKYSLFSAYLIQMFHFRIFVHRKISLLNMNNVY